MEDKMKVKIYITKVGNLLNAAGLLLKVIISTMSLIIMWFFLACCTPCMFIISRCMSTQIAISVDDVNSIQKRLLNITIGKRKGDNL